MILKSSIILFAAMTAGSCSKHTFDSFQIKNNSTKNLYYSTSDLYPDTSVATIKYAKVIGSGQNSGSIAYSTSSSGIFEIFLFDSSIFKTNSWDSIVKKYFRCTTKLPRPDNKKIICTCAISNYAIQIIVSAAFGSMLKEST